MKISEKQKAELESILYFFPERNVPNISVNEKDIEDFFNYSDRGIKPEDFLLCEAVIDDNGFVDHFIHREFRGFHKLMEGKRWREIHIAEMYEPGILDFSMPYCTFIDKDTPRSVVDFLKKAMFQGIDSDLIESFYQVQLGNKETIYS